MKKGFLIFAAMFSIGIIGLGLFGMVNSKKGKDIEPDDDTSKPVEQVDVNKLYDYVLGFGYKTISDNELIPSDYYSDIHQSYMVTVDNLSSDVILRNVIKQVVVCGGQYENATIPYDVVSNKIKEIVGREINVENLGATMYTGAGEGGYVCSLDGCIPVGGSYCSSKPLNNNYTMVNHTIENNNVIIIDQDTNLNKYKHIFTKDNNGNYYWVSTEPVVQ